MGLFEEDKTEDAKAIYENGAFSKSVSTLTLSEALTVEIAKGTKFSGSADTGSSESSTPQQVSDVAVFASADFAVGATEITVQYVNEGCYVGSNPDPVTGGCLAPTGTLTDANATMTVDYEYDVLTSTKNAYSVKLFTNSSEYSFEANVTTPDFQKYVDYYGKDIITSRDSGCVPVLYLLCFVIFPFNADSCICNMNRRLGNFQ